MRRWVPDVSFSDLGKGGHSVGLAAHAAGDVLALDSAHRQGVGDERAVAASGHGFGAHHGQKSLFFPADQPLQGGFEFGGLHIIGKPAERRVPPAGVLRIPGGEDAIAPSIDDEAGNGPRHQSQKYPADDQPRSPFAPTVGCRGKGAVPT